MEIRQPKILEITRYLSNFLFGKDKALHLALIACFSRGHLLIEDLPGLGKTTLALALARALGLSFGRVQCTSDLLPSDITGVSVFNRNTGEFEFRPGPVFNNIVLMDEVNRATPKTQSALLEAMGEKQTTIEGNTYRHPQPFFVIATQNPAEHFGTFPLPESQMDRFLMRIRIGYPEPADEKELLRNGNARADIDGVRPLLEREETLRIQEEILGGVYVSEKILDYILRVVGATREHPSVRAGISTRGALAVTAAARTRAFFSGRDHVIPEDIRELAPYTLSHRILLKGDHGSVNRRELVRSLLDEIPVPA
jgi:MoxR-like ATPase